MSVKPVKKHTKNKGSDDLMNRTGDGGRNGGMGSARGLLLEDDLIL
jgi:hypothetical protein